MKQYLFTAVLAVVLALSVGLKQAAEEIPEAPSKEPAIEAGENNFFDFKCNATNPDDCKGSVVNEEVEEDQTVSAARPPLGEDWQKWWCRNYTYRWLIPSQWGCQSRYILEDRCYGSCPSLDNASPHRKDYCQCCKGYSPYLQRINCHFGYIISYRFKGCRCNSCSPRILPQPVDTISIKG